MNDMIRVSYGGCASTPERRQHISRKGIYRASPIRPTDKWLSLRDLIIAMCQGFGAEGSRARAIKRPHFVPTMKRTS
jgi:hypothetical protein